MFLVSVFALTPCLGDNTRFFKNGRCFSNMSATRGRSFCGSSNMLVGLLYVMFLKARYWPVGAFAFHNIMTKRTLQIGTSAQRSPAATFVLSSLCAVKWTGSCCLQSAWTCPLVSKYQDDESRNP